MRNDLEWLNKKKTSMCQDIFIISLSLSVWKSILCWAWFKAPFSTLYNRFYKKILRYFRHTVSPLFINLVQEKSDTALKKEQKKQLLAIWQEECHKEIHYINGRDTYSYVDTFLFLSNAEKFHGGFQLLDKNHLQPLPSILCRTKMLYNLWK